MAHKQAGTPPPDCLLAQAFHGPRDSTPTHGVSALLSRFLTANALTQHLYRWTVGDKKVAEKMSQSAHSRTGTMPDDWKLFSWAFPC